MIKAVRNDLAIPESTFFTQTVKFEACIKSYLSLIRCSCNNEEVIWFDQIRPSYSIIEFATTGRCEK